MKVLYKYYSDKFDVVEHLQSPAIKLATTKSLNDPFEVQLSNELTNNLTDKLLKIIGGESEENKKVRAKIKESYSKISSGFGVVSLTETHRNLLMWAHYANSHKGVCIGYKTSFMDELNGKEHPVLDDWRGIYTPEKICYDSKRFEQETNDDTSLNEKIMQAMLKKSDDWIYEKEHRCIVPFHMADRFKVINKANTELMNLIAKKEVSKCIEKIVNENGDVKDESYKSLINGVAHIRQMKRIAQNPDVLMLKDIDISSICSIFIGSQHCDEKQKLIIEEIISNPDRYGHISVYKYHVHGNEFRLFTEGLVNGKILTNINDIILENKLDGFEYAKIN